MAADLVILGTPLREAKRLGMAVPILETLYCCVRLSLLFSRPRRAHTTEVVRTPNDR